MVKSDGHSPSPPQEWKISIPFPSQGISYLYTNVRPKEQPKSFIREKELNERFERDDGGRDEMNPMCLMIRSDSESSQHRAENLEWSRGIGNPLDEIEPKQLWL